MPKQTFKISLSQLGIIEMISSVNILHRTNYRVIRKILFSSIVLCQNFSVSSNPTWDPQTKPTSDSKWIEPKGFTTDISVYNPLTKKKTKLILQRQNYVKWYSCGPTVYDSAHIGHASSYVKLDIIRRVLASVFNIEVFFLMGVTDIDDKIIKRSNEAKEDFRSLAKKYEVEFFNDIQKLNILQPSMTVRVSDHIPEIISFIERILEKGYAYKTLSGSVYFAIQEFPGYGKLYPPQLTEAPEKPNPEKKSPLDFTLWKAAKPNEPKWDSPWGPGRPGWHIECSAMASKELGPRLDIHSGGQDLVFPHHANEEAQSCAHHNTSQWVNYWIHTGHLHVKGDVKMSKSLKNTISISELLEVYTSNHFRMLCMLSPYRNRIEYSQEAMRTAVGTWRRVESFIDECQLYLSGIRDSAVIDESALLKHIQTSEIAIRTHLADDFDTTRAMDEILRFVTFANTMLGERLNEPAPRRVDAVKAALHFVKQTLTDLGFNFTLKQTKKADHKRVSTVLEAVVKFNSSVNEIAIHPNMVASANTQHEQLLEVSEQVQHSIKSAEIELQSGDISERLLSTFLDAVVKLRSSVREIALHPDMAVSAKPQRVQLLQACDKLRDSLVKSGVELKDHGSKKTTWTLKDIVI